jgi:uncharacterized protein with HEPN domain
MRSEQLYLQDILDACDMIQTFLAGLDASTFINSELHKAAVLQKLSLIGEAAARLTQTYRQENSQIEWSEIIGFRNIAVHAYFSVEWEIVWATAKDDVPVLRDQIMDIIQQEDFGTEEQ